MKTEMTTAFPFFPFCHGLEDRSNASQNSFAVCGFIYSFSGHISGQLRVSLFGRTFFLYLVL
jgi:hypothetical protein